VVSNKKQNLVQAQFGHQKVRKSMRNKLGSMYMCILGIEEYKAYHFKDSLSLRFSTSGISAWSRLDRLVFLGATICSLCVSIIIARFSERNLQRSSTPHPTPHPWYQPSVTIALIELMIGRIVKVATSIAKNGSFVNAWPANWCLG
jgi:hypothetical protein